MNTAATLWTSCKRIDLHCHSKASTETDEAVLIALGCPESYSEPEQVYREAKRRGMDFVTISDHDCLTGVLSLGERSDVLVGEELTCYFPEDRCKIHLLIWGLNEQQHSALQLIHEDIYEVARYVHRHDLAHSVAHPLYRQNDRLDRWHVERLLLMFNGFETLNGAHSAGHREAFEPLLDELDEARFRKLEREHGIRGTGRAPWAKARTGGSDDHGLFNVGRTWTEFPADVTTVAEVLECIRRGRCRPGGEAGSSVKLAHNFYGVGLRYITRNRALLGGKKDAAWATALARIVGDEVPGGKLALARSTASMAIRWYAGAAARKVGSRVSRLLGRRHDVRSRGTKLLEQLLVASAPARLAARPALTAALREGRAPLSEHDAMFSMMSELSRDVAEGVAESVASAAGESEIGEVFDALSTIVAQQAMLAPYYFALFHQNQERHLLHRMTGRADERKLRSPRIAIFADDSAAALRFAGDVQRAWNVDRRDVTVVTSGDGSANTEGRREFAPLWSKFIPKLGFTLAIPPVLEILEYADRRQFDGVVISGSGPMALAGRAAAAMLRAPVVCVHHADLPAMVLGASDGDYRLTAAAKSYVRWMYGGASKVLARSQAGRRSLHRLGIDASKVVATQASPAPITVPPNGSAAPVIACRADVHRKADADLIAIAFRTLAQRWEGAALALIGDGPWTARLNAKLRGLPVVHVAEADAALSQATLYWHPAGDDVTGEHVARAVSAGVPPLVPAKSAGAEVVAAAEVGVAVASSHPDSWVDATCKLLSDEARRVEMRLRGRAVAAAAAAPEEAEALWRACLAAVADHDAAQQDVALRERSRVEHESTELEASPHE